MASSALGKEHPHIPLTRFHNNTGEFLDMSMRTPVILTSHGRPKHMLVDPDYFARIEAAARGNVLAAMKLQVFRAEDMPEEHLQIFEAAMPSQDELDNDRWADSTG